MRASHRIPMPSPSGRNRAGLFLPAGRFAGPVAAYDSKRGLGRDEDYSEEEPDAGGELDGIAANHPCAAALTFAGKRLGAAKMKMLQHLLGEAAMLPEREEDVGEGEDTLLESERWDSARDKKGRRGAQDEPPPFSGRPRPGGTMDPIRASDSLRRIQDDAWAHALALDHARKHGVPGLPPVMAFDAIKAAADEALRLASRIQNSTVYLAPAPVPRSIAMDESFARDWPEIARIKLL